MTDPTLLDPRTTSGVYDRCRESMGELAALVIGQKRTERHRPSMGGECDRIPAILALRQNDTNPGGVKCENLGAAGRMHTLETELIARQIDDFVNPTRAIIQSKCNVDKQKIETEKEEDRPRTHYEEDDAADKADAADGRHQESKSSA